MIDFSPGLDFNDRLHERGSKDANDPEKRNKISVLDRVQTGRRVGRPQKQPQVVRVARSATSCMTVFATVRSERQ